MKSYIGYFDPHLSLGSFSLKTKLWHICSGLFSLPFSVYMLLPSYSCSVVCSLKPISIKAFQNRANVEKIGRSPLESHFEVDLEIKQMQTVLVIKISSKNICFGSTVESSNKIKKPLWVVTYEKYFFTYTRTDKWWNILGSETHFGGSLWEWPFTDPAGCQSLPCTVMAPLWLPGTDIHIS